MLVGYAGVGKTVFVGDTLASLSEDYVVCRVPFNYHTTSAALQSKCSSCLPSRDKRSETVKAVTCNPERWWLSLGFRHFLRPRRNFYLSPFWVNLLCSDIVILAFLITHVFIGVIIVRTAWHHSCSLLYLSTVGFPLVSLWGLTTLRVCIQGAMLWLPFQVRDWFRRKSFKLCWWNELLIKFQENYKKKFRLLNKCVNIIKRTTQIWGILS